MFYRLKMWTRISLLSMVSFFLFACNAKRPDASKDNIHRVVVLGNSIVSHAPKADIGWVHDWGMAASCEQCDFVHILQDSIKKKSSETEVEWANIAEFEQDYLKYDFNKLEAFKDADILVVKISENVHHDISMEKDFIARYDSLLRYLAPTESTKIIITEGFWPGPINGLLMDYARQKGYPRVLIADLYDTDKRNTAEGQFEHEGVAMHPSDFGMQNIADRIWVVMKGFFR